MQVTFGKIDLSKFKSGTQTLIIGDVRQVLKEFPHSSVDLIYADPPYDDLEKHRNQGTTTRLTHSKSSSNDWYDVISYDEIIPLYARLLKTGKHLYDWRPSFNQESLYNWCRLLDPKNGLYVENDFVVRKVIPIPKSFNGMGYSWRSKHEYVVFAHKKGKMDQLRNLKEPDYQEVEWPNPKTRMHDSQKPSVLAKKIITTSSDVGNLVIEPFAGSFSSGEVNYLYNFKRAVIGIEKDKRIAQNTINYFRDFGIPLNVIEFNQMEKKD